ncbi:histone-lysine N-methyltransferase, H3 lysine-9 specific SUVH4-like [Aristolochia californica]|uniref:histone-lysine N-methyltransferase, H3 lysine-9 specific SUVH4-like n=1 Tax=Aristolochia californica TaxID=171875 RepID=UPI0035D9B2C6
MEARSTSFESPRLSPGKASFQEKNVEENRVSELPLVDDEVEGEAAGVMVTKSVSQRVQRIISREGIERRFSARLQTKDRIDYSSRKKNFSDEERITKRKLNGSSGNVEPKVNMDATNEVIGSDNVMDLVTEKTEDRAAGNGRDSVTVFSGRSAYSRVKETLRIFNTYYLHFVQEEEKRCKKVEANGKKNVKASKPKGKNASAQDVRGSSKRPDLKAMTKMVETNAILYPKRIGALDGIDVGHQFFSRAEMVAVGLHNHWLKGIDYLRKDFSKLDEYKNYTLPLAVSIVISGQYEDDLDNLDEVVYTGQGGNNLLGNKRQMQDQELTNGNLALKNSMEQQTPVRVTRGHVSDYSYVGKVYTYDGLYKVVNYWAEKGVSGFTVFKYKFRRLEGQLALTTNQVQFSRTTVPQTLSEICGLVCEDISKGQEALPIPATNLVDVPPVPPSGYEYCNFLQSRENVEIPSAASGCNCQGHCLDPKVCACARLNGTDFPYVHQNGGRLVEAKPVVFECGPNCGCGNNCVNRTSQHGLRYRLEVFRTLNKGWAVRSWDPIPAGAPICEYTGILMRTDELDSVVQDNFVFEIDCLQTMKGLNGRERRIGSVSAHANAHLERADDKKSEIVPEYCIDAGPAGNVTRFINHSCQPNLFVQCVLSSHHDIKQARILLFAAENIPPLQELTYDYGYPLDSVVGPDGQIRQMPCHCGAPDCRKRLY